MRLRLHGKKILSVVLLSCSLIISKPAHSFVWPAFAPTEVGLFVKNIVSALSTVAAGNAQIQGYIATIQAIGDQVSMVCKYAQDIGDAINSIEDSVQKLGDVMRKSNEYIVTTVYDIDEEMSSINDEKDHMAENTIKAIEGAL